MSTANTNSNEKQHILIVGSGEFGASTGLSLLESGKYTVTIIDRAAELPAMDAASTDINKVVRFDYAEEAYADLCVEAIRRWKKDFPGVYHESGVVISGTPEEYNSPTSAIRELYQTVRRHAPIQELTTPSAFASVLDPSKTGISRPQTGRVGYHNATGGWANAALGVQRLYEKMQPLGVELVSSAAAKSLIYDKRGNDVIGVTCQDGRKFYGDKVILAMGSWTGPFLKSQGLFPDDPDKLVASGLGLGAFQLSREDVKRYKDVPVIMAWDGSGFYCFPPNETGMMKFALHAQGYYPASGVPRTALSEGAKEWHAQNGKSWIPRDMAQTLRSEIAIFYPELASRPFDFTRMCYYSDTADGHWLIDYHPLIPSLMIASGGSGHAYKFLPVIGDLIHKRLENRLEPAWAKKFAIEGRESGGADKGRGGGVRRELRLEDLAGVGEVPGQETVRGKL